MIETGITKLDDYLMGGIPNGKSLVYYIHPGVEGNVFGMQTLYHNLAKGSKCVFIASSSDPLMIKDTFKEFGWNLDAHNENPIVVDAHSGLVGAPSNERYDVVDQESIDSLNESIEKVMEELDERYKHDMELLVEFEKEYRDEFYNLFGETAKKYKIDIFNIL